MTCALNPIRDSSSAIVCMIVCVRVCVRACVDCCVFCSVHICAKSEITAVQTTARKDDGEGDEDDDGDVEDARLISSILSGNSTTCTSCAWMFCLVVR